MACSEVCHSCARSMNAAEVVCRGFCKATFHFSCANVSEELYNEALGKPAYFWMCPGCREIMGNARFKNALSSMNAATIEVNDTYQKLIEDMKSEIKDSLIAEIRQEIKGGFNMLSPAVLSPHPRFFNFNNQNPPKRRRDDEASTSDQPSKILRGAGPSIANVAVTRVDRPVDQFWVYLSKISPEVSETDVVKLVKDCLHTDEVAVKSLIPRGRSLSTLSFISFKVGVSRELETKAMDPMSWPQGIEFREFIEEEERRPQNFGSRCRV
nr:uncharacterized protein LOC115267536 [Aedes albopictus]